jgi:lysozyme
MNRYAVGGLSLSAAAFVTLVASEYFVGTAMIPTKNDRPTVGFGSTFRDDGTPVKLGDTITPTKAVARSYAHIAKSESHIKQCVTAPLSQIEYDVLIDFSYQYGESTTCNSSMVKEANAGNYIASCNAYTDYRYLTTRNPTDGWQPYKWDKNGKPIRWRFDCSTPGNKVCRGVWIRLQERQDRCLQAQ